MRTPKTASELAAALRTMFAARVPHLVMAGQGPAWSIVGNADRLYDLQAAAQALDDLASAYNAQLQALQFLPDGTVRPVFCGADCVDEGLCRDTQSCDRVGAESVGRVNLAPARPADADRSDVGNAWAVLASHGYPDDGKTRLDDMILRAITAAPTAPVALTDDDLRDMADSACQEALSFGVGVDVFLRLARSVAKRAAPAAPVTLRASSAAIRIGKLMKDPEFQARLREELREVDASVAAALAAPVAQPVSAAEEFDAPHSCPAREAMGEHACQDRAQCWEPCGALGQSAAHVTVSKDYAPAPGVESEGGEG